MKFLLFFFFITSMYFLNTGDLQQNRMVLNAFITILQKTGTSEKLEIIQI